MRKNKIYISIILLLVSLIFFALLLSRCDAENNIADESTLMIDNISQGNGNAGGTGSDKLPDTSLEQTQQQTTEPPSVSAYGKEYAYDTEKLDLSNTQIENPDELIDTLGCFKQLKEVMLYDTGLSMEDKYSLVQAFPDVFFGWTVDLCGVEVDSVQEQADISTHIVEDFADFSMRLALLPRLGYIDMCDCGLDNGHMEELQNTYPGIKFVWKVTLGLWTIRTDCVAFSTLKDGTITYRLTNDDVQVLKYCTDMVALDLGHNKVTDISFLQYMPELKILILVDNWDGETAEHYISDLSMLQYVPKLMYLEFFVGDVSDISFLEYTPNLVDLNISYNPIGDVSYLLNLPKIERLYLEHTNLTEEDYKLLCDTYPEAKIVYYGEGSVDQGWREHDRYFAMIDMFHNNYVHELFSEKQ